MTMTTNPDLQPILPSRRTSTAWELAGLWLSFSVSIPSYYIAGSLVEKGMTWYQGITTIVAGQLILLVPLLLTSQPATRYGIPFPVFARSAFGIHGAHIPALLRALVGCGWFGINTWLGGQAIFVLLPAYLTKSSSATPITWLATSPLELLCFLMFWLVQICALWRGMRGVRELGKYSAPIQLLLLTVLLVWAYTNAGGFGPIFSQPSTLLSPSEFWPLFFPSLTANIANWGGMALSIPDFARYARSQKDQLLGQFGFPLFFTSYVFAGLAITSSTIVIFGRAISNPIELLATIGNSFTMFLSVPGIILALITTNIPCNVVAPANVLVNFSPSMFSFKSGAVTTALIGAVGFQPWRILKSTDSFVYTWLVSISPVLGSVSGILLADYYLIRRMVLNVDDLYSDSSDGEYYYTGGYNLVAVACLVSSLVPVIPGFLHKLKMLESVSWVFVFIYDSGWLFGFLVGGILYTAICCTCNGRFEERRDCNGTSKIKAKVGSSSTSPMSESLLLNVQE